MTYLDKLLNGADVEWKTLGEVAKITIGEFVHQNNQDKEAEFPVYNGGITPTGYYNKFNNTGNKIIVSARGANAGFVNRISKPYWAGNSCYSIGINDPSRVDWIFIYYFLKANENRLIGIQQKGGIPAVSKKQMEVFLIPIPCPDNPKKSLAVQTEIVRILDTFTELAAELAAELTARKKQYNYYREQLLNFEEGEVEWKTLGEVAIIGTGSRNTNESVLGGKYPFFVRSQEPRTINEYEFDETAIITAGDGVGVGKVFHFVTGKYALHQRAYRIVANDNYINSKYLFHFIRNNFSKYLETTSVHASVTSLRKPMFEKYLIPIPSPEEQARIVSILDQFDTLTTSISEGLPKEIALRQKQYEYYRDLLLTFPDH